jgi:ferric-dicitrate binding protein FerR (iron transport regulator)
MDMNPRDDSELEQRLRAAFEPEAEVVDRVVVAALHPWHRRRMALRVAAAVALVAASLGLFMLTHPRSEVQAESLRLEYVGNVALIESPDGSCWLVTADATSQASPAPLNFIIVEGEKP